MITTDPIADLLTRIRNAAAARHDSVIIPASRMKEAILKILKNEELIGNYVKEEAKPDSGKPQSQLKVFLKYAGKHKSIIHRLSRISRPGGRVYKPYKELKISRTGITILSTPKGVMTDKDAIREKVGGEILCEVW